MLRNIAIGTNQLPDGMWNIMAILLLKTDTPLLIIDKLGLNKENPIRRIDNERKNLLKHSLVDIVVYGKSAPYDRCSIFEELCAKLKTQNHYVLRELDTLHHRDLSMGRYPSDIHSNKLACAPNIFKHGNMSPHEENDCSGVKFILETCMERINQPEIRHQHSDEAVGCSRSHEASMYVFES